MTIKKVAVIGGGTMGSGIAEVAAKSGCDTIVVEIDASLAEQAQKKLEVSTEKAVSREKMTDEDIMEKFFSIVEVGNLYGPYTPKDKKLNGENRKDFWLWQCWRPSDVHAILKLFLPYFGKRRAEKTIEALSYENFS